MACTAQCGGKGGGRQEQDDADRQGDHRCPVLLSAGLIVFLGQNTGKSEDLVGQFPHLYILPAGFVVTGLTNGIHGGDSGSPPGGNPGGNQNGQDGNGCRSQEGHRGENRPQGDGMVDAEGEQLVNGASQQT